MEDTKKLSREEAWELVVDVLKKNETSVANAHEVADALVAAETDGQKGHGLSRLPSYVRQLLAGKVRGRVTPRVVSSKPSALMIDAAGGFAFPALTLAVRKLQQMAPRFGIAAAGIFHSHHFGQAGYHVERLAKKGLVSLLFGNSPKAIAPWGGVRSLFGTNPIAFAAPRDEKPPLVIDLSLSKVARGKVMLAKQRNESIPSGWALDQKGNPTTNPALALDGTMLPMGEAKGAALVLMVEILAAGLTGANFGCEASSFLDAEGGPPGVGQLLIALDPHFFSNGKFSERLEFLIEKMLTQPEVRLPGSRRLGERKKAEVGKLTISKKLYQEIRHLA